MIDLSLKGRVSETATAVGQSNSLFQTNLMFLPGTYTYMFPQQVILLNSSMGIQWACRNSETSWGNRQ